VKGKLVPLHALKAHGVVNVQLHLFLTLALNGRKLSALYPGHSTFKL